ncbi:MBL fold metallo-hydrolase [Caldalkalibacillus thermarum TA2.A1]|uniref:MBL fold metallo-hydrolase n=1 Tax=Caldalkalibacillus thermarum (strain TA2.A1) TaxID=986075 RepID=A0A8X8IBA9_CALTT|nr:MBL fold metallo-hydrolase [Caldalkalibacillus thermarum]QZT35053.1 MBL fold metallo-hydrolase [Caldalkalibacillus thermarum TA2.A1]
MTAKRPVGLGHGIYLIDGYDLGFSGRTGTYVFAEEALTIIETGPSPSVQHILEGLNALGLSPEAIQYIIVTHIHLDHAGGAGILLEKCPHAQVVVHPRGARHLADPSRLIAGAKAIYQDQFDRLFDPIVPVPEDRLLVKNDGDTLAIGPERTLKFLDTPGHSRHHFSIYDPVSNGIFSGDTFGIRYPQMEEAGGQLYLPSTSPNHFDPAAMRHSIERMCSLDIERIYFGHYGMTTAVDEARQQVLHWLDVFVEEGKKAYANGQEPQVLAQSLLEQLLAHHKTIDIRQHTELYEILKLDMMVSSLGIFDYLAKQHQN